MKQDDEHDCIYEHCRVAFWGHFAIVLANRRLLKVASSQALVCEYFEVPIEMVKSKTRKREIVQARQISMYLAKLHTKTSLKSIGAFFGGRDHSTVIYACQTVDDLIDTDKKFKGYVADIQKKLKMS